MNDLRLALRAFRWRRGGSIVVLVAGVLTVAAAALGPLFSAAAAESVLQDRLVQAEADQTTIAFRVPTDVSYPGSVDIVAGQQSERGSVPGYGPPVHETVVKTTGTPDKGLSGITQAVWRETVCEHVVIVDGTCSLAADEAIVSARTAEQVGWVVGTTVALDSLRRFDPEGGGGSQVATVPAVVRVTGTYRPKSTTDPFWAGRIYFPFHPNPAPDGPSTVDSVFVSADLFPTLVHPTPGTIGADLVLTDPEALRVADVPTLRAAVESYLGPDTQGPTPTTGVLELLDAFEQERAATTIAAGVVTAQLALLAWLLLYLVVTDTSEARGGEVALAKLRGLPPRAVAAVALREPVLLLLLAVPVGLLVAYGFVTALARGVLAPGVPVVVTPSALVAVALAFLGGLVAAGLASRRMFTRPVLEQWSTTSDPGSGRTGLVADVVLAVVALAGFVVLATSTGSTTGAAGALGWLAPGLLVIAAGLLLVRLARPVLGGLARATRASTRIGLFLGSRQAVRRPAGLRLAALLAITIGLATFAVDAQAAAATGRVVRAGADVGAQVSVAVQQDPARDLEAAVASVDPEGRWAMVVADWIPSGQLAGRVLGVQTDRLAQVAAWSDDYGPVSVQDATRLLAPTMPDPVPLTTATVRVRITSGPVASPAPTVRLSYRGASDVPTFARGGPLLEGTHDYVVALPCDKEPCTLNGVVLDRAQTSSPTSVDLTLVSLQQKEGTAWTDVDAHLDRAADWRVAAYTGDPVGTLGDANGLHYTADLPAYASPWIQFADIPEPLPLITATAIAPSGQALRFVDGNGRTIEAESVGANTVLPLVGNRGSLVDLTALRRSAQQLDEDAHWSVWLGPDAPADAIDRLTAAGVVVDSVSTQDERAAELSREGPALALRLLLVCAVVGALLAAGALAISVAVTGRRRSYELAALSAVGTSRPSLLRACVLEQALLLGTGLVVGVPVGVVVARLALPLLPQSSSATTLPLTVDIQVAAVAAFALMTAALLLLTAVVGGIALLRQAVPDRLREVAA